jgi:molecular chaperone DnaJ
VQVDVPAGIADGQRIRLSGRGHAGERGGPAGDLYVVVRVREDERFLRDGSDLGTVIDVPAPLAALGTTIDVPTLDDPVPVEIKAGT